MKKKKIQKSIAAVLISGAALFGIFHFEKQRVNERKKVVDEGEGKPLVGGPFSLVDLNGKPVTDMDFRGKFTLIYFGYTFCPDVCPEELEKMAKVVNAIDAKSDEFGKDPLTTLFVSCDPKRDSIKSIKEYLRDFHPKFIGLTGTHQQIKRVARAYRMYYSAPPRSLDDDDADYLVDHSIFFYLIDPDGQYVTHFGRQETAESVTEKVLEVMRKRNLEIAKTKP
ncbi:Cu-binding protein [Lobulomyces angularis]|nr:Cu-binding protein [Lobulomyces angularis]